MQSILLGAGISVPAGVLGVVFASDLLRLMGASAEIAAEGRLFTAIMLGGSVTVTLLFLINAVFRGAGEPAVAMQSLWIANGLNMLLDPLLIFGWGPVPELGLTGAAIATTGARGIGVAFQLWRLGTGRGRLRITLSQWRPDFEIVARLVRVGSTGVLQFLVSTASFIGLVRMMAWFGDAAVAGYTIAVRIIIFVLLPAWGIGNAAATLVGQNLGARRPDRAERAVWITGYVNAGLLAAVAVVLWAFTGPLVATFTTEPTATGIAVDCLRIVSLSYPFWAYGMVTVMAFNGAGDTTTPTFLNFVVFWVLQLPLAWLLSGPLALDHRGIFVAIAVAQAGLAVAGIVAFRRGGWKTRLI